jgi:hypothetical protein
MAESKSKSVVLLFICNKRCARGLARSRDRPELRASAFVGALRRGERRATRRSLHCWRSLRLFSLVTGPHPHSASFSQHNPARRDQINPSRPTPHHWCLMCWDGARPCQCTALLLFGSRHSPGPDQPSRAALCHFDSDSCKQHKLQKKPAQQSSCWHLRTSTSHGTELRLGQPCCCQLYTPRARCRQYACKLTVRRPGVNASANAQRFWGASSHKQPDEMFVVVTLSCRLPARAAVLQGFLHAPRLHRKTCNSRLFQSSLRHTTLCRRGPAVHAGCCCVIPSATAVVHRP